jgi:hypothetical protein
MKKIDLPFNVHFTNWTTTAKRYKNVDLDEVQKIVGENRSQIITYKETIENELNNIITCYFVGKLPGLTEKSDDFVFDILREIKSQPKRRIIANIIKKEELLSTEGVAKYDDLLEKVTKYRNSFAHGRVSFTGQKFILIGNKKDIDLNDSYFDQIKKTILECLQLTVEIRKQFEIKYPDVSIVFEEKEKQP